MKNITKSILVFGLITGCGAVQQGIDEYKQVQAIQNTQTMTGTDTTPTSTDTKLDSAVASVNKPQTTTTTSSNDETVSIQIHKTSTVTTTGPVQPEPAQQRVVVLSNAQLEPQPTGILGTWASNCDDGLVYVRQFRIDGMETTATYAYPDQYCHGEPQRFLQELPYVANGQEVEIKNGDQNQIQVFKVDGDILVLDGDDSIQYNRAQVSQ